MKMKCMQAVIMLGFVVFCSPNASAKVWRVNNNAGVSADFSQLQAAVNNAAVNNNDTIYIEGSATIYGNINLAKRLVIIGTGYFLSENPGLQASVNDSWVTSLTLDSLSSGSQFYGIRANQVFLNSNADNIRFSRCNLSLSPNNSFPNSKLSDWVINKCYINSFNLNSAAYVFENLQVTNCILNSNFAIASNINALIRNNTIFSSCTVSNAYVANNIFVGGATLNFTNCTVKYNISQTNNLPGSNNNQVNIPQANLFILSGSSDGRFQLRAGSPAIGAGEPVSGVTPDCGAFGTADPYRLSGIPPIPSIYALTVPASIPSSATSITVTVSTRSNN